jgi:hypothetical protein
LPPFPAEGFLPPSFFISPSRHARDAIAKTHQ